MKNLVKIFEAIVDTANDREGYITTPEYVKAYAENGMDLSITEKEAEFLCNLINKYDENNIGGTHYYYHMFILPIENYEKEE